MLGFIFVTLSLCSPRQPDCIQANVPTIHRLAFPEVLHTDNGDFAVRYKELPCTMECCLAGLTYHDLYRIEITPGMDLDDEIDTVIHEALHAETGGDFPAKKFTGHDAIYELSGAMQHLLKANPELVTYLGQR
jgi:hypothetical protein